MQKNNSLILYSLLLLLICFIFPSNSGPVITSITPISYKGGIITISGNGLMVNESLSAQVGFHTCKSPTQIEFAKSFYCTLDYGLYDSLVIVYVWVASVTSNPYSYNVSVPRIDSFNQINSIVSFVGVFEKDSKIMFNDGVYEPISINETNIEFQLELQFKSGMITIGTPSNNIPEFKLTIYPTIIDTTPTPTEGGNTTFSVAWSGNPNAVGQVTVAGKNCLNVIPNANGSNPLFRYYQCQVGPGVGTNYTVEATINSKQSTTLFSYAKPNITRIEQNRDELIIIGDNFGDGEHITVDFYYIHTVPIKVTSHHVYKIQIPDMDDSSLNITVGGQSVIYPVTLYPAIMSNITELTTDGGINTMTLMFIRSTYVTIYIGDKQCDNVIKMDNTTRGTNYTCVFPKGSGANNVISFSTFIFTNRTSAPMYYYRYQAPRVINSNTIPDHGGILTVIGSSFGSEEYLTPIVTVGNFNCNSVTVVNSSILVCVIDGNEIKSTLNRHQYVNITVDGLSGGGFIPVFDVIDSGGNAETPSNRPNFEVILASSVVGGVIFLVLVSIISYKVFKKFKKENTKRYFNR